MTEKPETCFCGEPVTDTVLGLCRKHEQEYDRMLDERYWHREERGEDDAACRT